MCAEVHFVMTETVLIDELFRDRNADRNSRFFLKYIHIYVSVLVGLYTTMPTDMYDEEVNRIDSKFLIT